MGTKLDTDLATGDDLRESEAAGGYQFGHGSCPNWAGLVLANNVPRWTIVTIESCSLVIIAGRWWARIFLGI